VSGFAYGCCVGSWHKFMRYVEPKVRGRLTFATSGHSGIVAAYNGIINALQHRDVDGLILVHDDLEILDVQVAELTFRNTLADPDVGLVGVAGGGGNSLYWWEHDPIGHQLTDKTNIDFGQRTGDVTLIEGSIMVLSPWLIRTLRFDPIFTGFHGYDEIGTQVKLAGKRVVVADVDTHHHNMMGYVSEESAATCRLANKLYQDKWSLP
jgi:hypothetical protein